MPVPDKEVRIQSFLWLASFCLILQSCTKGVSQTPATSQPRAFALTRVIRVPAVPFQPDSASGNPMELSVTAGASDEPPEGPNGLGVLNDGSFVLTDPLRRRLVLYSAEGKYKLEWNIGFAADFIRVFPDGQIEVREANTGAMKRVDSNGRATGAAERAEAPQARLTTLNRGVVESSKGSVEIRFDVAGLRLLSLQRIAEEAPGEVYVALEATPGGETLDIGKFVRKYVAGALVGQISDIPLDYYVQPNNELQVSKGVVYQLMPTKTEIRINMWNTSR